MAEATISTTEFKLLRDLIEKLSGIALGEEKAYLIETRLAGLLAENGCQDFGAFYRLVICSGGCFGCCSLRRSRARDG